MKRVVIVAICLLVFHCGSASAAELSVTILGLQNSDGSVRIALFNRAEQFPDGKAFVRQRIKAHGNGVKVLFRDLPIGDYAIAVLHDKNNSSRMDYSWLGFPQEAYAFSGRKASRKPTFKDALFQLAEERASITINLQ